MRWLCFCTEQAYEGHLNWLPEKTSFLNRESSSPHYSSEMLEGTRAGLSKTQEAGKGIQDILALVLGVQNPLPHLHALSFRSNQV